MLKETDVSLLKLMNDVQFEFHSKFGYDNRDLSIQMQNVKNMINRYNACFKMMITARGSYDDYGFEMDGISDTFNYYYHLYSKDDYLKKMIFADAEI